LTDLLDVERAVRHSVDVIKARPTFIPTPQALIETFGFTSDNPMLYSLSEATVEQIRLSCGFSLVTFFRSSPTREQLLTILDRTLQDLTLLRKNS
jgi:hypothetical protein